MNKKLMITGCGRSGTRYITLLLRQLGLDIGHEAMKKDGITSWCSVFPAEKTPWGEPSTQQYSFDNIFHQVRHPLKVIPSVCSFKKRSWQFICNYIPSQIDEPDMLRSAKYWYYWNSEAEKISQWRYKIEDINSVFEEFCQRLGIPVDYAVLENIPTDVNTRKHGKLFHYYDEIMDRLFLYPTSRIRNRLKKTPSDFENQTLSWEELKILDSDLYTKIRNKAIEYGYED